MFQLRASTTLFGTLLVLGAVITPAGAEDCENWNTMEFFEQAAPEQVRACLQSGADANAVTEQGATPLHWAVAFGPDAAVD